MNAAIFIDGGYFDRVSRDCGSPRIDFGQLSAELARPHELLRTYYYHCLPYMGPNPSEQDQERYDNKHRFFNALTRLNRFEVREGKLEYRGTDRETERPIFEQKRVDIYLGVDLAMLAVKQRIHRAILVTGDSDFLPAIRAAKNEGVLIHLFHGTGPQQPHRDLWEEADDRTVITPELLQTFLLASPEDRRPYERQERTQSYDRPVYDRPDVRRPYSPPRDEDPAGDAWPLRSPQGL